MRSIRKATLSDIHTISACDSEFGFGNRKEFIERAIPRGGSYVLEQEGKVIRGCRLGVHFLRARFYLFDSYQPDRTQNRSRRDVVAISAVYLRNPEAVFLNEPKQRCDAGVICEGRFRAERRDL